MTDDAIKRSVLSDQVKGRLLQAILDGRYPPGARIVETRVAREFGTSQAPVREALRDLEALGVVETAPFRGARVRQPSTEELIEAFDVRSILEVRGAHLAMASATPGDMDTLRGFLDQMGEAAAAGDPYAEAMADAAFHGHIMHLSGNATLERVWRTLEPFLRTYITIVSPGVDRRAVADRHEPIIEAFEKGDEDLVRQAFQTHFDLAAKSLAKAWPGSDPTKVSDSAGTASNVAGEATAAN